MRNTTLALCGAFALCANVFANPQDTNASAAPTARDGATGFNPEVSLILDGKFTRTTRDPETYKIRGFIPSGGEIEPPARGFSLGEIEVALSANVGQLLRGDLRLAIAGDGSSIGTEEASVETLALPAGLKLKAGRFFSGIGYLNAQHPHSWDFVDAPLAYKAFYGSRLSHDGVQLKWVAPTPVFLELGAEWARGGGFPGGERARSGVGLTTLFAHIGGDVGVSNAWQAGLSYVTMRARDRGWEDVDSLDATTHQQFSGRSKTLGADFVWKWAPNGDATRQNFKLQTEIFQRRETGDLQYDDSEGTNSTGSVRGDYRSVQTGAYAQAVWQFMPRWRVGYRRDQLRSGSVQIGVVNSGTVASADIPALSRYSPSRDTLMFDWAPTETSRVRVQFARDNSRGPGETDRQFFLQYVVSLGAHGAHRF